MWTFYVFLEDFFTQRSQGFLCQIQPPVFEFVPHLGTEGSTNLDLLLQLPELFPSAQTGTPAREATETTGLLREVGLVALEQDSLRG